MERRTLWQTAWGTIATIAGALVIGLLIADISASVPVWAIVAAGIVTLVGLYCVFAPVWGWPPFRHADNMDSVPENHSINVTSHNQSGGITAHTVNISSPQAKVRGEWIAQNQPQGTNYLSRALVTIDDPYAANGLRVEAEGASVNDIDLYPPAPPGATVHAFAMFGVHKGPKMVQIGGPLQPSYHVDIFTESAEPVSLDVKLL